MNGVAFHDEDEVARGLLRPSGKCTITAYAEFFDSKFGRSPVGAATGERVCIETATADPSKESSHATDPFSF